MQRYFVTPEQFQEDRVEITGDDARHIAKVMRGRLGDPLIVSDGVSREAMVKIESMEAGSVSAVVVEPLEMTQEPRLQVSIAQSLPKGDKMETVIQKCTEIGAVSFVPFLSERTIVQYDAKKEGKRLERWRKIAKEAAEQAHRNRVPSIEQPLSWKHLLASFTGYDAVYFCYEQEHGSQLRDMLKPFVEQALPEPGSKASLLLVVGPEGGFTEEESRAAEEAGAVSVGLGRRILRCETAGMTALACALYESGEMGAFDMPSVAFYTLGCKVNFYDTEAIWQYFKNEGYEQVDFEQTADVYLINTCHVTNTGDKKSRQMIRRAIRRNPEAIVAVTGCYAQTSPAEILDIPGVDLVIGNQDRDKIMDFIHDIEKTRQPINAVRNIMKTRVFEEMDVPNFAERTRAFLKIQDGCNNFCTFCIIPWSRGLSRSREPKSIIQQAHQLVDAGYKEIVLTGIHTGGYGDDLDDYRLSDLLWDLDRVDGLERIRISSIEASQIDEKMLDVLNRSNKMCRHLHIPLQAGDDTVLKRMRRKYTTEEYYNKMTLIRQAMPDLGITTDVIVGFPGETDEMFRNGYELMKAIQFSEMHVFPYSKRTGTPAARMEDQVDDEVKNARVHDLIDLSEQLQLAYAERFVGQILEVIPEREYKGAPQGGMMQGYSDNYLQLVFNGAPELEGKLCRVKVTKAGVNECEGELVGMVDHRLKAAVQ